MITLKFTEAQSGFFDRPKVQRQVDAGARKVLSKFGAFVRTRAKSSIRKRKAISSPGQPPSSHLGLLRKFIFFSYDAKRKSVVIGPTRLNQKDGTAPRLLEKGGTRREKGRTLKYRPRPFMGPAFTKELENLPAMWRNAVRAS